MTEGSMCQFWTQALRDLMWFHSFLEPCPATMWRSQASLLEDKSPQAGKPSSPSQAMPDKSTVSQPHQRDQQNYLTYCWQHIHKWASGDQKTIPLTCRFLNKIKWLSLHANDVWFFWYNIILVINNDVEIGTRSGMRMQSKSKMCSIDFWNQWVSRG